LVLFLVCSPGFPLGAAKGKAERKIALRPHPQANQDSFDATGNHSEKDFVARESDGPLDVQASLMYWEGENRTASVLLSIQNQSDQKLFIPSTIVVILPNGHSYRPFNQADVLQGADEMKNRRSAEAYSGYNPPPATTYNTNCSLSGSTASCRTTADQSQQVGYAVGFALGAAIRNAIIRTHANEYIKQVKEKYLVSRQIQSGDTLVGYVDIYLEDVHSGPFVLRVAVGDKTYNFVFGPESIAMEFSAGS